MKGVPAHGMAGVSDINLDIGRLNAVLAALVTALAVILLALAAARLFWAVVAGPATDIAPPSPAASRASAVNADFSVLERATPFRRMQAGTAVAATPDTVASDAPDTALSLTLHGVFGLDETAVAYISAGEGPQTAYRPGDRIDGLASVTVERILPDTVLLRREGRLERLTNRSPTRAIIPLNGAPREPIDADVAEAVPFGTGADEAVEEAPAQPPPEPTRRLAARINRAELEELAASLRIDPKNNGLDHGVSVFPTRNAALMQRAGLRAGDVVQRIGGVRIDGEADLARIIAEVENETVIEVALVRSDQPHLLTLRLDN